MQIRQEKKKDWPAIADLNTAAFETPKVAAIIAALRKNKVAPLVSLVAEEQYAVVGHVIFSPVSLPSFPKLKIMALGPLAVAPDKQRHGIGAQLVQCGLKKCKDLGAGAVIVLGHPTYYPRFGFTRATDRGISCALARNPDAFMLIELKQGYLVGASGSVEYDEAFNLKR